MLLDLLILLLLIAIVAALIPLAIALYLSAPLADVINAALRRIGLAGPSPDSRAIGVHATGIVDEPFEVREGEDHGTGKVRVKAEIWNARCGKSLVSTLATGDTVEIVYNDDLTVTVVGRRGVRSHTSTSASGRC